MGGFGLPKGKLFPSLQHHSLESYAFSGKAQKQQVLSVRFSTKISFQNWLWLGENQAVSSYLFALFLTLTFPTSAETFQNSQCTHKAYGDGSETIDLCSWRFLSNNSCRVFVKSFAVNQSAVSWFWKTKSKRSHLQFSTWIKPTAFMVHNFLVRMCFYHHHKKKKKKISSVLLPSPYTNMPFLE